LNLPCCVCKSAREYHELQFASYYSDHMVLQRAPSRAVLWGYSSITDDNITITLQLKADSVNTVYKTSVHATGLLLSLDEISSLIVLYEILMSAK